VSTSQREDNRASRLRWAVEQAGSFRPRWGEQAKLRSPPAANSAANAQEMEELGDLQTKLEVRAETENNNVENLRKQMAAGGNNLRSDISASQSRMKVYMDKFSAALSAGDPVAAKKYMGMAEREVETLEKFFGH